MGSQTRRKDETQLLNKDVSQTSLISPIQFPASSSLRFSQNTTPQNQGQPIKELAPLSNVPPLYEVAPIQQKMVKTSQNAKSQNNLLSKQSGHQGELYKEYLPNIIKKQIDQDSQIYYKPQNYGNYFNQHKNAQLNKQMSNLAANMTQPIEQQSLRQDVSYLKENLIRTLQGQSPLGHSQPTIFTTGDRSKDELIEVTLGKKNLGQSLIDLPGSLNELFECFRGYADQLMPKEREDLEERLVSKYMEEHFQPTDILKEKMISLRDYKSSFLESSAQRKNSQTFINQQNTSTKGLNYRHQSVENLMKTNARVPKISTKPEQISVLNPKITKQLGKDAFFPSSNSLHKQGPSRYRDSQQSLNVSKSQNNMKEMMSKILKTMDEEHENSDLDTARVIKKSQSPREKQAPLPSKVILQPLSHQSLGNPSSRQDAIILAQWLEKMLLTLENELKPDLRTDFQLPLIQLIFNITIQELSRQVAVHCVERGQILKTVFHSYINLIELIYNQQAVKRKKMKVEFALKLDKYVTVQEDQMNFYKTEMENYQEKYRRACQELEMVKHKLNTSTILNQKFKQKLVNIRKDLEGTQKKLKFLTHENIDLRSKLKDLSDRFEEEVSIIDEQEQRKMLEKIEKDFEDNKKVNPSDISNEEILKEEDQCVDTWDFELYLLETFGSKVADAEIQTDKQVRRNVKVEANSTKLGLIKEQSIQTEEEKQVLAKLPQHHSVLVRSPEGLQLIQEKGIHEENDDIVSLSSSNKIESFQEDKEEEEDKFDDEWREEMEKRQKRKRRLNGLQFQMPKRSMTMKQYDEEIGGIGGAESEKQTPRRNQMQNKISDNDLSQVARNFKLDINQSKKFETQPQPGMLSLQKTMGIHKSARIKEDEVDILAMDVKNTVNQILNHEDVEKVKQETPEFYKALVQNVKITEEKAEDITQNTKKRSLTLKKKEKEEKKKSKILDKTQKRVNQLEVDNYLLREYLGNFIDLSQEQQSIADELLSKLNKDQLGPLLSGEVKKALQELIAKLQSNKDNKNLQQLLESKPYLGDPMGMTNNHFSIGDNIANNEKEPELPLNQYNSEEIQDPKNFKEFEEQRPKQGESFNSPKVKRSLVKKESKTELQILAQRKKQSTKFALFNFQRKGKSPTRKGAHPCYPLLKRIQGKNPKDLKDIMPKTMLLKVIYQVYQEKTAFETVPTLFNKDTNESSKNLMSNAFSQVLQNNNVVASPAIGQGANIQQSLLEWVYDYFMQKYGFKNLADKKFNQLIQTCILQKDYLPRIRLFGRFLEIYDELSSQDYNKYLEIVDWFQQQVLNLRFEDDEERILIPYTKALDYYKYKFELRYIPSAFQLRVKKLERMRISVTHDMHKLYKHLKGSSGAVDFDLYAEFILENYIFLQTEKEQLIKDVFVAIDNDNNGLMNRSEFIMVMKVMHRKGTREGYRLFEEYAEVGLDENSPDSKNLSLGGFMQMALDKNFFGPQMQINYVKSNVIFPKLDFFQNVIEDHDRLLGRLERVQAIFKQRLVHAGLDDEKEYKDLLDTMMTNIQFPFSKRAGWLSFRILDDFLKSLYLKKQSDRFMPFDIKKVGIKANPSSKILGTWPDNYYDTLS